MFSQIYLSYIRIKLNILLILLFAYLLQIIGTKECISSTNLFSLSLLIFSALFLNSLEELKLRLSLNSFYFLLLRKTHAYLYLGGSSGKRGVLPPFGAGSDLIFLFDILLIIYLQ